jgi:hypothetical protein
MLAVIAGGGGGSWRVEGADECGDDDGIGGEFLLKMMMLTAFMTTIL